MRNGRLGRRSIGYVVAALLAISSTQVWAENGPKTPQEFAERYLAAFNKQDHAALKQLRYPTTAKSDMQDMMDSMANAEMDANVQYSKYEVLDADPQASKPAMGPDGVFYQANIPPTNMLKITSVTKDGTSSSSFLIGKKDGVYYQVGVQPAAGAQPAYQFGWQRFTAPQTHWSVMMPNEPEPGKAALEKQFGKEAANNADAYGVVENTGDIKAFQHFYRCGQEGKRVNADDNKEMYRVTCTTYTPETLQKWFSDGKKNLADAVDMRVRENDGKLVAQKAIELNGAPGQEFEITDKNGTLCLGRVYWIKDALYGLTYESRQPSPNRENAAKFLGSLQVE